MNEKLKHTLEQARSGDKLCIVRECEVPDVDIDIDEVALFLSLL